MGVLQRPLMQSLPTTVPDGPRERFSRARLAQLFLKSLDREMEQGTIKRITDKGFGFIATKGSNDMFFHSSALDGVHFNDLREGQEVTYTVGQGPKGPRAENVQLVEKQ